MRQKDNRLVIVICVIGIVCLFLLMLSVSDVVKNDNNAASDVKVTTNMSELSGDSNTYDGATSLQLVCIAWIAMFSIILIGVVSSHD